MSDHRVLERSGLLARRAFLGGLLAVPTSGAFALTSSPMPIARPDGLHRRAAPELRDLVARANLGGDVSIALADCVTGEVIEAASPLRRMPPASVAKSITALYALDTLGPAYRFTTRVLATGPFSAGRLDGDLILQGGGDPALDTDVLAKLAGELKTAGLREVSGVLRIDGSALPYLDQIDPEQVNHAGYNPAISGLNLNYNRVHFEWRKQGADFAVTMQARTDKLRPEVRMSRMKVVARDAPLFTFAAADGVEQWSVARRALGQGGSRWLPVRRPSLYAGEVFATMLRSQGIVVKLGKDAPAPADAAILARHDGEPLREVLRDMLKYSTNLTAETAGLSASAARGVTASDLETSALEMNRWASERLGTRGVALVDHSGLGEASRVSGGDMARLLAQARAQDILRPILKPISWKGEHGAPDVNVAAKTGTLDFVSSLAGYLTTSSGRRLSFAIFTGDLERRAAAHAAGDEVPAGARSWNARAKTLQRDVLRRWTVAYGA